MSDTADRLAAELAEIPDPRARLARLVEISADVGDLVGAVVTLRREAIQLARDLTPPLTWREIGSILGVSPQRAEFMSKPTTERNTR